MAALDPTTRPAHSSAEASRWGAVLAVAAAFLGFGALGVLLVWIHSFNPIFGGGLDDPGSLVFILAFGLIGAVGALVSVLRSKDLHPEVKQLADAGEKARAIQLLRDLKGLDETEATQQIERYLPPPNDLHPEVKQLADAGEKVRAIQLLCDLNGVGLAEAKDAVERYVAARK